MTAPTFFTALAPDEQIQGSRDPLGLLPIWSRLGRQLIGNVTTVSGDLRGWTTLLIMSGLYRERVDAGLIDEAETEPLFRAEQLVAYSRVLANHAGDVRGLNQIKKHLNTFDGGRLPIPLGLKPERRILTAQQSAGVWGQISSPAGASQLIDRRSRALTPAAAALWSSTFAPKLAPFSTRITEILTDRRGFEPARGDGALAAVLAGLHQKALASAEIPLYRDHILYGGGPASTQREFVELWRAETGDTALREGVSLPRTAALAQHARAAGLPEVAAGLEHIVASERLLAPMERLFSFVQGRHRASIDDTVAELRKEWNEPIASAAAATDDVLGPPVHAVYPGAEVGKALTTVRDALTIGAWEAAIYGVIELNAITMRRRGGAEWVRVVDGKLDVRLADESSSLPELDDLHRDLVHSYYLDPIRRLIVAWEDGQRG